MTKLIKVLKIVSVLFIGINETIFAYNWPIKDFNKQHPICGTLGEYRTPTRIHKGVDIRAPDGTPV